MTTASTSGSSSTLAAGARERPISTEHIWMTEVRTSYPLQLRRRYGGAIVAQDRVRKDSYAALSPCMVRHLNEERSMPQPRRLDLVLVRFAMVPYRLAYRHSRGKVGGKGRHALQEVPRDLYA